MPPHKAKFRWRNFRTVTDQETVETEFGLFKVGGTVHERNSAARGKVHVCSVVSTWTIPTSLMSFRTEGTWRIERPDGSVHSEGVIDGTWGAPKPSDKILEEIVAGA